MAAERFQKRQKALLIKGRFHDKEELIKVAKSVAAEMLGNKAKISVVNIGVYIPDIDGQTIVVEFGCGYNAPGGRRKSLRR